MSEFPTNQEFDNLASFSGNNPANFQLSCVWLDGNKQFGLL